MVMVDEIFAGAEPPMDWNDKAFEVLLNATEVLWVSALIVHSPFTLDYVAYGNEISI
jgi:hypothetical protein